MNRNHTLRSRARGFSLLEVLIAVVLLATGLLALAALQGALARNSADAKIRSRVVSLLEAELDAQRASAYANVASLGAPITATDPDCSAPANDVEVAACDAGIGSLTVNRTVTLYGANAAGTAFDVGAPAGSNKAEFKQIVVTASWTDATGQARTASMRTSLSSLALNVNNPLVDNDSGNDPPKAPVVRQADPTTVGMIPIAMGNGDSTAASNPTPEQVGKNQGLATLGTRFTVLTYTPQNNLAEIQARVETEVVKCTCQYGAGGNNLGQIYRASQWPAIWTGTRYDVYLPDTAATAPGQQYASGPKAGVTQSALCQECCRDHHDNPSNTTHAKFDPESTATTYQKYDLNGSNQLVVAGNTTSSTYVDSCRMIRVDGMWRTAADMYSRQFGVLETTPDTSGTDAKNGAPTTTATANYTTFVKDYLKQYDGSVGTAPGNAQALFDEPERNLEPPPTTDILTAGVSNDDRYVHGRGLYVDFLEKQAREKLAKVLADRRAKGECAANSTGLADCVLPYLPFTTVNLTEIADWVASDTTVLEVNTQHKLGGDASKPSGGTVTRAFKNGSANNTGTIRISNSGVAVQSNTGSDIPGPIDIIGDATTDSDAQPFVVGGSGTTPPVSFTFFTQVVDASGNYPDASLTQVPSARYATSTPASAGNCANVSGQSQYLSCSPGGNSGNTVSLVIGNYARGGNGATENVSMSLTCDNKSGTFTVARPFFEDWRLASASLNGSGLSVTNVSRDGYEDETTTLTVTPATNDIVKLHFVFEEKIVAQVASCKITGNSVNVTWTTPYPWK